MKVKLCCMKKIVAFYGTSTESIHNSQCLSILCEFYCVGVVASSSPLPLTAKELLKRVLAQVVAQENQFFFFNNRNDTSKPSSFSPFLLGAEGQKRRIRPSYHHWNRC